MAGDARQDRVFGAFARVLRRVPRRRTVVALAYHDLREEHDIDSWLRVPVGAFRRHLQALSAAGPFVDPAVCQEELRQPGPQLSFLLTFDDGYRNNLRLGKGVLEELRIPALFFVSSHNLTTGAPFWFDRVVTPIQTSAVRSLDLRAAGLRTYTFSWPAGPRRWDDIQALLVDLKRLGNPGEARVDRALESIEAAAAEGGRDAEHFRPLSVTELREMSSSAFCKVGSHGHRHEMLPLLDDKALRQGLAESRTILQAVSGQPVTDLAYPNGSYDARVIAACREVGFERAFIADGGAIAGDTDPFAMPRLLVGGYDSTARLLVSVARVLLGARRHAARPAAAVPAVAVGASREAP